MRDYTEVQRKIMNNIIEINENGQKPCLSNILNEFFPIEDSYFYNFSAYDNTDSSIVVLGIRLALYINNEYFLHKISTINASDDLQLFIDKQEKFLIDVVNILSELDDNKMVTFYGNNNNLVLGRKFNFIKSKDIIYTNFDGNFCKELEKYLQYKKIIPKPKLISFIKNGYKSDEVYKNEKLEEKKLKQTSLSLLLVSIGLILSLIGNIYQMFFNPNNIDKNIKNHIILTSEISSNKGIITLVPTESNFHLLNISITFPELFLHPGYEIVHNNSISEFEIKMTLEDYLSKIHYQVSSEFHIFIIPRGFFPIIISTEYTVNGEKRLSKDLYLIEYQSSIIIDSKTNYNISVNSITYYGNYHDNEIEKKMNSLLSNYTLQLNDTNIYNNTNTIKIIRVYTPTNR